MTLDRDRYLAAVEDYNKNWRALDDALYGVCNKHAKHDDLAGVVAKVYIIARSYTAQIERHVPTDGTQGGSLMKVIRHLHDHAAVVDALLAELKGLAEPLTCEALTTIASIHGRFVKLISGITRDGMGTPSFASKYLHFHHSVIPIYDSVVVAELSKTNRWRKSMSCFPIPADADAIYARYLTRLWPLYTQAVEAGLPLSVKYLDYYAVSLAAPTPVSGGSLVEVTA